MLHRMYRDFTKKFWRQYNAAIKSGDFGLARSVSYRAISFYQDAGDDRHSGIWQRVLSNVFYLQGNYDQALVEGNLALAGQTDPYERALTLIVLATLHVSINKFETAFELFGQAAELGKAFPDDVYLWTHVFGSRAIAHRRTGDFDKAIIDWEGAAALLRRDGQLWRAAVYVNNIGFLLTRRREFDQAESRLLDAFELLEQDPHVHTEALVSDSLGYLYTLTNRHREAEAHLRKSIKVFERLGDKTQLVGSLLHLSQLRRRQIYHDEAQELALRSLDLAREVKSDSLVADAREVLKAITLDQVCATHEAPEPLAFARRGGLRAVTPFRSRSREPGD